MPHGAVLYWCRSLLVAGVLVLNGAPPVEFAPGIVSTGHEFTVTFSPDGHEVYFTRSTTNPRGTHIMRSVRGASGWQAAEPVSFSVSGAADLDPALSPDGSRLYFVSTRPRPNAAPTAKPDMDIWYADRQGESWGTPHWIQSLSSDAQEGSPTIDRAGTLCFFSDRGQPTHNAIYCAAASNGGWSAPVRLDTTVNAGPSDTSPFLSPDGNAMLFYSERAGGFGQADLYVTVKRGGAWQPAVNLGAAVNTASYEYNPSVSPDGATLYFGRDRRVWSLPIAQLDAHVIRAEMFR